MRKAELLFVDMVWFSVFCNPRARRPSATHQRKRTGRPRAFSGFFQRFRWQRTGQRGAIMPGPWWRKLADMIQWTGYDGV